MLRFVAILMGLCIALPRQAQPPPNLPAGLTRAWEMQKRHERSFFARVGVAGVGLAENAALDGYPVVVGKTGRLQEQNLK